MGPEGSGTHALTMKVLKANDIDEKSATLLELTGEEDARALVVFTAEHLEASPKMFLAAKVHPSFFLIVRPPEVALTTENR